MPKEKLNFEHIRRDAKKNDIIPKYLVLVNGENKVIEKIDLRKEKNVSTKWLVPCIVHSYILYVHQFISKSTDNKIFISNFLQRGFPIKRVVDSTFLISIATRQHITIRKMIIYNKNNSIKQELFPFDDAIGEIVINNKQKCKLFYDFQGENNVSMEITLHDLLLRESFPREKIHKLKLEELQECMGFNLITLVGFQSDKVYNVQHLDINNFEEIEHSDRTSCFVYYTLKEDEVQLDNELDTVQLDSLLQSVRLDNLLERKMFPHVHRTEESDSDNDDDRAISKEAINNPKYLNQVKEIYDFLYSFEPKRCSTCNNRWFVTKSKVPGNVKLDILDPIKNKNCFQFDDTKGTECERCRKEIVPDGLPKLYSAGNNMDFGPMYDEISELTTFEEMLLAKVSTLVSVCTLTSTGFLSYQGHCVSFFQNSVEWYNKIPRRASACKFILIVRKGVPASSRRKAFKVSRVRIQNALTKLMEVNKHYSPDKIDIDEEYLESLPEDDYPIDINMIEKEMDDIINIQKDLFDKWIELCKPIGYMLSQYYSDKKIQPEDLFSHVCQEIIIKDYNIGSSITNLQLVDLLIKLKLINIEDQNNGDLILGELTHASMILEGTENTNPTEFGNIVHGEAEGQITACGRNFDEMSKAIYNTPSIDDVVVVTKGDYKYNIGIVKEHNEDGNILVFFETVVYTGSLEQQLLEGKEYEIQSSQDGTSLRGVAKTIDGNIYVVIANILLKLDNSDLHIQSKPTEQPVQFDLVTLLHGSNKGKQAFIKEKNGNNYKAIFWNGNQQDLNRNDLKVLISLNESSNQNSQHPHLSTPGIELSTDARNPMPLFEPPIRDENPIPERDSNILACAFPTLFQTGEGDIYAPRLRSLNQGNKSGLDGYIRHCVHWHDNRFAMHPRFLYILFNRLQRCLLLQTKTFYLKNKKPTPEDFLPKNKIKTIREMRAFAAKLPTTPGNKLQRRNEVETTVEQLQYVTATKFDQKTNRRTERVSTKQETVNYESSDDEEQHERDSNNTVPTPINDSFQEGRTNKKVHKRPIEGVIPCYWATLTTAPFRTSLIPYYINGNHETDKDVRKRRHLAIQNPNIVAFFSALRLELILKYLMVDMLELEDYYCVFEWGSGGVLHLHCILWNFQSQYLDTWDLEEKEEKKTFSKRKLRLIADFFNTHVSEWNLGKEADGSWTKIPENVDNAPHPASISKQEFDELFDPPASGDIHISLEERIAKEEAKCKRLAFIVELLEKVQQHNIHKPNPFGPPLPNQKCSKQKPAKEKLKHWEMKNYCAKGFPKPLCECQKEYIQKERYKEKLYKLYLERNDGTINNYNSIISLALLANMDIQPVLTFEGMMGYCTKYITKKDNPDLFRDFRDDTGKPTDAGATSFSRNEIPAQQHHIQRFVSKWFNDEIKYSMISSPELNHHILRLPAYLTSRSYKKISLQSDLSRLVIPTEVDIPDQNIGENQPILEKEDEVSIYEKRCTYTLPPVSIGVDIQNMSLFLFHRQYYVRKGTICRKSKAPIISFKPYISPKKKNNPKYAQYMVQTLLAYKPFTQRNEYISLSEQNLEILFLQFIKSDLCPFFVKKKYKKANEKRKYTRQDKEKNIMTGQDEIENAEMGSSSDESDSDREQDAEQHRPSKTYLNKEQNEPNQLPQIGKISEPYQEFGHLGSKGYEYVGSELGVFDDDKDVTEEINTLSDEQDLIFDPSKDSWQPLYPDLIPLANKSQETIRRKNGLRKNAEVLDPKALDPTQSLFVDTILEWETQCIRCIKERKPFPPLKIKLLGVAGTGKSRTIKTLVQEFNKVMLKSDLPENVHGKIKMCAPTGVAAFNIGCGAASVHKTFSIPVRADLKDLTGEKQKQLELDFENVWLVIIDEISMVGCEMFAKINDRLIQAKLDDNNRISKAQKDQSLLKPAFGGIGMVLCGDFGQLVPIMQKSLMDNIPDHDASSENKRFSNKGKTLIDQFKISIILTKQHRQNKGIYTELCLKFRDGSFLPKDYDILRKRDFNVLPLQEQKHLEMYGTKLVTTNKQAGKCNAEKLISLAKESNNKILRIHARETGIKGKPMTSAEDFSGLKSTIHITIGSRVMVTSNIWVEAGLINGAQGTVKDIVFDKQDNEDPFPEYVMVSLDQYNGPSLFDDDNKSNWVPFFPMIRQHQFRRSIERTQIPLRLSSAMTGHKVQGLSLYNGVIVDYPPEESTFDPMDTWGLNYCILTRVPDITKIAFNKLPDYGRHMKLFRKSKGKNHFKLFQNFDKKAFKEFERYVKICGGQSLDYLKSAKDNLNIYLPIDFYHLLQEKRQEFQLQSNISACYQLPLSIADARQATTSNISKDNSLATGYEIQEGLNADILSTFSKFENKSNDCWFNSVLQVIIHAIKNEENVPEPLDPEDNIYAATLLNNIKQFCIPDTYHVGMIIKDPTVDDHPEIHLKHLMLKAMDIDMPQELENQQDASQCIQSLLEKIPHLNFLKHHIGDQLDCDNCSYSRCEESPTPVTQIEISKIRFIDNTERFSAKDAITGYFQNQEKVKRQCDCLTTTSSKKNTLTRADNYIIIQFKRYSLKKRLRGSSIKKITAKSDVFSFVNINTSQGVTKYEVIATIEHTGDELTSGHYMSYILKNDTWYRCNDESVQPMSNSIDPIENVYILLLKKVIE